MRNYSPIARFAAPALSAALLLACSGEDAETVAGPTTSGGQRSMQQNGGATTASGGATNNTGGATATSGGAMGVTGGAMGVTGGATAASGGAMGASGGAMGASGGAMNNSGGSGGGEPAAAGAGGGASDDPGKILYEKSCAVCHGKDGKGVSDASGKPLGVDARHPVEDYTKWLVRMGSSPRGTNDNYVAPMPAMAPGTLSDADLDAILGYLSDRQVFPQPTTGQELFEDYCAACHGKDGQGGPTGRPFNQRAKSRGLDDEPREGTHAGEYENTREFMPKWSTDEITDAELALIVEYINQL